MADLVEELKKTNEYAQKLLEKYDGVFAKLEELGVQKTEAIKSLASAKSSELSNIAQKEMAKIAELSTQKLKELDKKGVDVEAMKRELQEVVDSGLESIKQITNTDNIHIVHSVLTTKYYTTDTSNYNNIGLKGTIKLKNPKNRVLCIANLSVGGYGTYAIKNESNGKTIWETPNSTYTHWSNEGDNWDNGSVRTMDTIFAIDTPNDEIVDYQVYDEMQT